MKKRSSGLSLIVIAALLFLIASSICYSQEAISDNEVINEAESDEESVSAPDDLESEAELSAEEADEPVPANRRRIEMEINTSTLPELAAWCRSLGLSEGGTVEVLRSRLSEYFNIISQSSGDTEDKRKIITIESAKSTEYFTLEAVDEDYARLSGDVKLTLRDGEATHEIHAWDILFNRSRNIITASGGVEYTKRDGDKIERFRGDSITVNIDDWSSIFLGGISERSLAGDGTTYLFSGTVITKDNEDVTVLSRASISSGKGEESLWTLAASRVWLLPGSDFAIFNAVLKVGEIPVMYIPFFYYPADEVIFHPVIGYRSREGNFIQTTTYILGRPKASEQSESSLTRILGSSNDMEKVREGIFLRSTGKKIQSESPVSLKVLLDYYTNLGGYLGSDLVTPRVGILNPVNLSVGFGFTRTISDVNGWYTPFAPDYDGSSDWNSSTLFSKEVPFRYNFKIDSSISGQYGSFSWNIPYYSDPWMDRDFMTRAESMDWVNMIQKGAATEEEITVDSQMGAYAWRFSGRVNPKFPSMTPYINSISLNDITSTISFKGIDKRQSYTATDIRRYSPSSFFFSPDTATLYSTGFSVSGTPLKFGGSSTVTGAQTAAQVLEDVNPFNDLGIARSPWENEINDDDSGTAEVDELIPPVLSQRFDLGAMGNVAFSLDYRLAPTSATELQFNSQKWQNYDEIDWSDVSTIRSIVGGDASTTLNLNQSEGLFSGSFSFSGNGSYRQYAYLNDEAEEFLTGGVKDDAKVRRAREDQYRQTFFTTSYGLTGTVRPLYKSDIWKQSNVLYNMRGLAVRSNFTGDGDNPEWEMLYGEWDKDKIDTHQLSANLAASIMEKTQSLKLTADLPPKDPVLASEATFNVWITETRASFRVRDPGDNDKRVLEPFYFYETLRFGTFGTLSHNMVLDTEEKELTTITSSLNLTPLGLSLAYTATRTQGYELSSTQGWVLSSDDPSLKSKDVTLNFAKTFTSRDLWKNRLNLSLSVNSRLFFDLQRYSYSNFSLSLGVGVGITNFLTLNLSVSSENSVIYRYYRSLLPDLPAAIRDAEGDQYNVFMDLVNSFRFDDENKRRSSGFKMKSFTLTANHLLGDWNANLSVSMAPYLPAGSTQYELNTDLSFVVQWVPISEIKTDMSYNKRDDKWIVK